MEIRARARSAWEGGTGGNVRARCTYRWHSSASGGLKGESELVQHARNVGGEPTSSGGWSSETNSRTCDVRLDVRSSLVA